MRLWSVHPEYLDRQGLVALWREGLLGQKVLAGKTRGYCHHPQLIRFREAADPLAAIGSYLYEVAEEAGRRGYQFNRDKIERRLARRKPISVSRGQLRYEREHLLRKLKLRDPARHRSLLRTRAFRPHPSFRSVPGPIQDWEKL